MSKLTSHHYIMSSSLSRLLLSNRGLVLKVIEEKTKEPFVLIEENFFTVVSLHNKTYDV
jgi:hypothetical protein